MDHPFEVKGVWGRGRSKKVISNDEQIPYTNFLGNELAVCRDQILNYAYEISQLYAKLMVINFEYLENDSDVLAILHNAVDMFKQFKTDANETVLLPLQNQESSSKRAKTIKLSSNIVIEGREVKQDHEYEVTEKHEYLGNLNNNCRMKSTKQDDNYNRTQEGDYRVSFVNQDHDCNINQDYDYRVKQDYLVKEEFDYSVKMEHDYPENEVFIFKTELDGNCNSRNAEGTAFINQVKKVSNKSINARYIASNDQHTESREERLTFLSEFNSQSTPSPSFFNAESQCNDFLNAKSCIDNSAWRRKQKRAPKRASKGYCSSMSRMKKVKLARLAYPKHKSKVIKNELSSGGLKLKLKFESSIPNEISFKEYDANNTFNSTIAARKGLLSGSDEEKERLKKQRKRYKAACKNLMKARKAKLTKHEESLYSNGENVKSVGTEFEEKVYNEDVVVHKRAFNSEEYATSEDENKHSGDNDRKKDPDWVIKPKRKTKRNLRRRSLLL